MLRATNRQTGFTIIEVLIVLVIAAVIMLIVFLAVPALQRNSRNNGRNNDAARIASAVRECMQNNNYTNWAACDTLDEIGVGAPNQLTGELTAGLVTAQYSLDRAHISVAGRCQGSTIINSGLGARGFAITWQNEPDANRCING